MHQCQMLQIKVKSCSCLCSAAFLGFNKSTPVILSPTLSLSDLLCLSVLGPLHQLSKAAAFPPHHSLSLFCHFLYLVLFASPSLSLRAANLFIPLLPSPTPPPSYWASTSVFITPSLLSNLSLGPLIIAKLLKKSLSSVISHGSAGILSRV